MNSTKQLFDASLWGNLVGCRNALENGADVHATSAEGYEGLNCTPLYYAVAGGHLDVCKCIVDKCANTVNVRDNRGMTLLHVATQYGHCDICTFLIDKGVSVNIKTNNGDTPLRFANVTKEKVRQLLIAAGGTE